MNQPKSILRLRQKYSQDPERPAPDIDVQVLLDDQSLQRASLGALLALVILHAIWACSALLFDRFYPWGSIVQGFMIGRAVRHFGRGIDWRFPLLAAVFSLVGALTGSFVTSLNLTAREFSMSALPLVTEVSWHTIETFVTREFGVVGLIYGVTAAVLAAFYANRRLDRFEALALRKMREQKKGEQKSVP